MDNSLHYIGLSCDIAVALGITSNYTHRYIQSTRQDVGIVVEHIEPDSQKTAGISHDGTRVMDSSCYLNGLESTFISISLMLAKR